ncbi:hypothetical protein [Alkalibacterium pelagium]|uniref:Uncharacterized protein n=1 Tax=Alkalibacterium pelagium TaxID=426702 RepID=A0A1H7JC89_9LACT|nr:hypothetical protein [Alkalibacterium pelagium]GEN50188.1 hypothetical protein APE02nite_08530 [Alkalibacterium pelagium]SEK72228.1 hypothetical protein SAMN04488099_105138 [Alkalibacterium pelagium]
MKKTVKDLLADRAEVQETRYKYLKVILVFLAVGSVQAYVL